MRQRIIEAGKSIYVLMKNPVGLAVVTGVSASATNYVFSQTQLSQDLNQEKKEKKQLEDTTMNLTNQNNAVVSVNIELQAKNNELRDELTRAKEHLVDCNHKLAKRPWFFSYSEQPKNELINCSEDSCCKILSK